MGCIKKGVVEIEKSFSGYTGAVYGVFDLCLRKQVGLWVEREGEFFIGVLVFQG